MKRSVLRLAKIAKALVDCFKCTDSNLPIARKRRGFHKLPPIVSVCDTYLHPSTAGAYVVRRGFRDCCYRISKAIFSPIYV
jgi:hypothetical protein